MASIRTAADQIRSLKATLPKGTPDNVIIIQNGRQPHLYMCTTCHEWRCMCDVPRTTRRYAINRHHREPLHLESTVYEGGFVVPRAARKAWSTEPDSSAGTATETTVVKLNLKSKESKESKQTAPTETAASETATGGKPKQTEPSSGDTTKNPKQTAHPSGKKSKRYKKTTLIIDLSSAPITARHPFRVSTAHWASRSHTQQWPWKGGLECKLLSQNGQPHQSWSRHTHCFTHAAKHKH